MNRDFDIVLVGATGFVGRLTAAHLATRSDRVRIAIAGRDRGRLERTRAQLPAAARDWELVVCDVTDADQARELAERTRVVCSTVGPYEEYGKALVTACAEAGTHYCDLTGEVTFVRWSVDTVDPVASRTGALIVHSCGFDSVPSELGVLETARAASQGGDGTLTDTVTHVRSMKGGLSGGTFASMRGQVVRASEDEGARRLMQDPFALAPDREQARREAGSRRERGSSSVLDRLGRAVGVRLDPAEKRWNGPFFMASYNTRVVRASNVRSSWSYGRDFRYAEVVDGGPGLRGLVASLQAAVFGGTLLGGMAIAPARAVLDRVLPAPGEGPSEESMARGRFMFDVDAVTSTGARYRTRVADRRDPGYTSTAVMLGESALALAQDEVTAAGVHTPATGLGSLLSERLRNNGFRIESTRLTGPQG